MTSSTERSSARAERAAEQRQLAATYSASVHAADRIKAARSRYISTTDLLRLIDDSDMGVRDAALKNPLLPVETMSRLINEGLTYRTVAVMENRAMPEALWITAARKNSGQPMSRFLMRVRTAPLSAILILAERANEWEAPLAVSQKTFPLTEIERLIDDPKTRRVILRGAAHHPLATTAMLRKIIARDSSAIMGILQHKNCPPEVANDVAINGAPYLKYHLASSKHLTREIIGKLLEHGDHRTLNRLISNKSVDRAVAADAIPHANVYTLRRIVSNTTGDIRQRAIARLNEKSRAAQSRYMIAAFTDDADIAIQMCNDPRRGIRDCAARNPVTPEEGKIVAALLRA